MNDYLDKNVGPMTVVSLTKEGYKQTFIEACPCETETGKLQLLKGLKNSNSLPLECTSKPSKRAVIDCLCQ